MKPPGDISDWFMVWGACKGSGEARASSDDEFVQTLAGRIGRVVKHILPKKRMALGPRVQAT